MVTFDESVAVPKAPSHPRAPTGSAARCRVRIEVAGTVQGVGFRPFVHRLACEVGVDGWIANAPAGAVVELEGVCEQLARFLTRLRGELPPPGRIHSVREAWLDPVGFTGFEIRESQTEGTRTAVVLPDLATCAHCAREVMDPADRRAGYPFANCTACGPRFSIIRELPYDRPNTTMADFRMCAECAAEYADPWNRRFHAQPIACAACGPALSLRDAEGTPLPCADCGEVLERAAAALAAGRIVAVKGIGGFHLMVDARDGGAVALLRQRKERPAKPFALMVADVAAARALCEISDEEEALLASPEAPIVLLPRLPGSPVAEGVAPGISLLGVMLPPTPLHHLLTRLTGFPLVATSGNRSEEPICTDEAEAVERLGPFADLFVMHDRPIERHVDDSLVRVLAGAPTLLRRARGYAPLPLQLDRPVPTVLAVGAHLKNTVALALQHQVFVSQHIGDLETPEARDAFERVIADFLRMYGATPAAIACDLHPDYASTVWAQRISATMPDAQMTAVQHHHAHLASCLAENGARGRALGIVWDGSGYGGDGTLWGGEFLVGDASVFCREASLLPFRLPGGDTAAREPRRSALALLWETLGERAWELQGLDPVAELDVLERRTFASMLRAGFHSPATTSIGRLFDGVAALAGVMQRSTFEGEAAMRLEQAADLHERGAYSLPLFERPGDPVLRLDWRPLVQEVVEDRQRGVPASVISARFHNGLVRGALRIAERLDQPRVALSGGAFQNRILADRLAAGLRRSGVEVLVHRRVPPNDGGISLGQVAVAAARLTTG
jgi:hydrogenase maturation protein HypF